MTLRLNGRPAEGSSNCTREMRRSSGEHFEICDWIKISLNILKILNLCPRYIPDVSSLRWSSAPKGTVNSICILVSTWLIWINPQPSQLDSDQFLWDFSGFLPKNVRYQRLRVWAWRPELPQGRCSAPCLRRASAAAVPWGSVWWSASRHGAGGEETWPVERWPKSEGWDGWWLSHLFNSNIYELYNIIHKLYCNNGIYIYIMLYDMHSVLKKLD